MSHLRNDILEIIKKSKEEHNTKNALFLEKYINYYNKKINNFTILYESFCGSGIIDNPYGIFKAFQERDDFMKYKHVWVIKSYEENWYTIIELSKLTNVVFVEYGSDDYLYYLSTAKYLINNCTFPTYFTKKEDQIYINTWHGVTNKYLGYDVPNSNIDMGNTIRNFLSCDYIVSADSFMTSVYLDSYKLRGLWEGKFIEVGQPRNDLMHIASKDSIISKLKAYNIKIDTTKKIILYAPTWRGTLNTPEKINYEAVKKAFNEKEYQVLIKTHHVNYEKNQQYIPASIDTNELISICDILITDYSSIYYDWLLLNKPVVFYATDYEKYKKEHGLYRDFPFKCITNIAELKLVIKHINEFYKTNSYKLQLENNTYNPNISNIGTKVLECILDNKTKYIKQFKTNKTKLLFYAGDFKPNGVTVSFSSLLNNINYNKYDVSIIALKKQDQWYIDFVNSINKKARVLCRAGTYSQTLLEECANNIVINFGIDSDYLKKLLPLDLYKREFLRCFGKSNFDKLINFTGYSPFYSYFFMCNNGEKITWLHNDMLRDQNRIENGIKPLYNRLGAVFTTYPYYDKLISATSGIMNINIQEFPNINKNKFLYAHNTIDYKKVIKLSTIDNDISVTKNKINFVTTGRLSYAKNQIELIKAFHKLHKKYNNCELYIIGDGNMKSDLQKEINNADYIHLTGYTDNPYNTMKKCDCFVFPSLYEGQGLAVLEARILHLPIVVSPLPPMRGIIVNGSQHILNGFTADDIYAGMEYYINNKNAFNFDFDYANYNSTAYKEFEEAIDL